MLGEFDQRDLEDIPYIDTVRCPSGKYQNNLQCLGDSIFEVLLLQIQILLSPPNSISSMLQSIWIMKMSRVAILPLFHPTFLYIHYQMHLHQSYYQFQLLADKFH